MWDISDLVLFLDLSSSHPGICFKIIELLTFVYLYIFLQNCGIFYKFLFEKVEMKAYV